MIRSRILAAVAAFLVVTPAVAQWQVPQYSVPVGRGPGITGFANALGSAGQTLTARSAANPIFLPGQTNVKALGATGNGIRATDGAITAASAVFTSASANFQTTDVGKVIVIDRAGALGYIGMPRVPHVATITSRISATSVNISAAALATVAGATYQYGTDDRVAIQNAINSGTGTIYFPKGRYLVGAAGLTGVSNQQWLGDGMGVSTIALAAEPTLDFISFSNQSNVAFRQLTFDGFELLWDFNGGTFPRIAPIIYYVGGRNIQVEGCEFLGWDTTAFLFNTAHDIDVSGNYVIRSTQSSGHLTGGTTITGSNGAITNGTTTFTGSGFVVGDVNKVIIIEGAGPGGITLVASIVGFTSATQVTINRTAGATVSNARYAYSGVGGQVSVTGIEMAGTGTVDDFTLRNFTIRGNTIKNGSIGVSGYNGTIIANHISGHSFGAGIHTQALLSNFNTAISGNTIVDGFLMQDTAGAYPGGIENWSQNSSVSNNTVLRSAGPGISIGGRTSVIGNVTRANGQMKTVTTPTLTFAGIGMFYQDATFNSSGSFLSGNLSRENLDYGYLEHTNLVGVGSDINAPMNDFGNNIGSDVQLQSMTRNMNMIGNVTINSGGFSGGTHTGLTTFGINNFTGFQTFVVMGGTNTGNRTFTINPVDADRTLTMAGNVTFSGAFALNNNHFLQITPTAAATIGVTSSTSIGAGQYQATATNDNATAGNIGEYMTNSVASTGIASATPQNAGQVSLTAGDWDVNCNLNFTGQTTTAVNYLQSSISSTSATNDLTLDRNFYLVYPQTLLYNINAAGASSRAGPARFSLSATTTVYCVATTAFASGTTNVAGKITARRVR